MVNEVENMRKEIVEFEQHFEEQRIRSMAWWDNSARCREEKAASKEVMDDYEILKGKLSPEARGRIAGNLYAGNFRRTGAGSAETTESHWNDRA